MDVKVVDHYKVLGLPSGTKGAKLGKKDISKAYRAKALQLHPDKRPNDPNANANFKRITLSYEVLKDPIARKLFDSFLRLRVLKRDLKQHQHQCQQKHQYQQQQQPDDHTVTIILLFLYVFWLFKPDRY